MTDDVFVYLVDLPDGIDEMVTPCNGGYTVYIDSALDDIQRMKAYRHALWHIENDDFNKDDVNEIEMEAYRREQE